MISCAFVIVALHVIAFVYLLVHRVRADHSNCQNCQPIETESEETQFDHWPYNIKLDKAMFIDDETEKVFLENFMKEYECMDNPDNTIGCYKRTKPTGDKWPTMPHSEYIETLADDIWKEKFPEPSHWFNHNHNCGPVRPVGGDYGRDLSCGNGERSQGFEKEEEEKAQPEQFIVSGETCRKDYVYYNGNCYLRWHGSEKNMWLTHENREEACKRRFWKNKPVVNPDENLTRFILEEYMKDSHNRCCANVWTLRVETTEGKCDCFTSKHEYTSDDDYDGFYRNFREPCSCEEFVYPLCSHPVEDIYTIDWL